MKLNKIFLIILFFVAIDCCAASKPSNQPTCSFGCAELLGATECGRRNKVPNSGVAGFGSTGLPGINSSVALSNDGQFFNNPLFYEPFFAG